MKAYATQLVLIMLVALPLYLALRKPWRRGGVREWLLCAFMVYAIALACLIFRGKMPAFGNLLENAAERWKTGDGVNLVPLRTIRTYFTEMNGKDTFYVNLVGNVVLFVPVGFFLPLLWKANRRPVLLTLTLLVIPVAIEFVQLFVGRSVDVDDVILNFAGEMTGALLYAVVQFLVPPIRRI